MGGNGSGRYSEAIRRDTTQEMLALDIRVLKRQGSLTKASRFSFAIQAGVAKVDNAKSTISAEEDRQCAGRTHWHEDMAEETGRLLCLSDGPRVNLLFPSYIGSSSGPAALPKERLHSSVSGYRILEQQVQLTATPCALGGHRLWWRCPCCDERAAILYLRLDNGPTLPDNYRQSGLGHLWGLGFFACRKCLQLVYESQYQSAADRCCLRANEIRFQLGATHSEILRGTRCFSKPKGMHYKRFNRLQQELWWRHEVFMAEIYQQFARYDLWNEIAEAEEAKKQQKLLKRQQRLAQQEAQQAVKRSRRETRTTQRATPVDKSIDTRSVENQPKIRRRAAKTAQGYWKKYAPLIQQDYATKTGNAKAGRKRWTRQGSRNRIHRHRHQHQKHQTLHKTQSLSVSLPTVRVSLFKLRAQQFNAKTPLRERAFLE